MSKKKVFVAVPTVGTVVDAQVYALRKLEDRYKEHIEFIYPQQLVRRIFHDAARNAMVEEFLESGADCLWFLDSDIAPPRHVLDLVALHWGKWQAAGAPYPVFMTPPGYEYPQIVFTVYKGTSEEGMHPTRIPSEGCEFVDGIATGCLFVKREVFEKLETPYFAFSYDEKTRQIKEGEDISFCKKLNALGIQFFVDYSMLCGHRKEVDLLDVNNYALFQAKQAVERYDSQIRGQIDLLAEKLSQRKQQGSLTPGPTSTIWTPR